MTDFTLGHFGAEVDARGDYLKLSFSPLNAPLHSRWRNNGLSADFLSDYVTTFLPGSIDPESESRQNQIRHAISFVANELLENAMKYHERNSEIPIEIHMELRSSQIAVTVRNGVTSDQAVRYRGFAQKLVQEDAATLLSRALEESASHESTQSGLGLLTMVNDYQALLGWRFEQASACGTVTVSTSVVVDWQALTGASA